MTEKFISFQNRLQKVYKHLQKIADKKNVPCYRVYDKDLGDFPFIIDKYNKDIVVFEYESKHKLTEQEYEDWQEQCLEIIKIVFSIGEDNLHFKLRKRKHNRQDQYQKIEQSKQLKVVEENGIKFYVNFNDYLDTGLFLDHRPTRKMFAELSNKKNVLNLFCYTGAFSIYSAMANAQEVWSLDLSNTYLDWGKQNQQLNKIPNEKIKWIKCDVLKYVDELPNSFFDLVIFDPPTFSNSKMMKSYWDVQEHHLEFLQKLHTKCKNKAIVFFSNNARHFLLHTDVEKYFTIKNIKAQTTDFDFQGKLNRHCFILTKKDD